MSLKTWDYEEYELDKGKLLGSGSAGKVFKCYSGKMKQYFVLKTPHNNNLFDKNIANEINIWLKLEHKNIIKFHAITQDPRTEEYSIVLQFADGGDLNNYLKNNKLEWSEIIRMAKGLAAGVHYLHNYQGGIIHGDLV
ncbi:31418_t:CDS:2 [Racocetra persica]|uniref:31418_t:CDS:1 n=1 Tax=Racocetra persica TaxID=160502 RepID=A0ACA9KVG2_9GLOM|nr:31418_t:CDS:2 [Racocetra persica]